MNRRFVSLAAISLILCLLAGCAGDAPPADPSAGTPSGDPLGQDGTDTGGYTLAGLRSATDLRSLLRTHTYVSWDLVRLDENGDVAEETQIQYYMENGRCCQDRLLIRGEEQIYTRYYAPQGMAGARFTVGGEAPVLGLLPADEYDRTAAAWLDVGGDEEALTGYQLDSGFAILTSRRSSPDGGDAYVRTDYYLEPSTELVHRVVWTTYEGEEDQEGRDRRVATMLYGAPYVMETDPVSAILAQEAEPSFILHFLEEGKAEEKQSFSLLPGVTVELASSRSALFYGDAELTQPLSSLQEGLDGGEVWVVLGD